MKAYLILLGAGANRALPAMLTAFSSGAAKQAEAVTVLRAAASVPDGPEDRMLSDLTFCRRQFSGPAGIAFFRTEWSSAFWLPRLPEREEIAEGEESRLLLQALRGEGVPFSLRTDREAVEWSASALLEKCLNETSQLHYPLFALYSCGVEFHIELDTVAVVFGVQRQNGLCNSRRTALIRPLCWRRAVR